MKGRWMLYVGGIWGVGLLAKYCPCNSITHQVSPQREHHPCKKTMITLQCLQWTRKKISLCFWVVDLEIAFFFQTWKSHSTVIVLVLLRVHAGFISLWWFVPLCLPNMTPLSIFNETEWKIIGVCCSHQEHGGQLNRLPAHQMVRGATSIICYRSSHSLLILCKIASKHLRQKYICCS